MENVNGRPPQAPRLVTNLPPTTWTPPHTPPHNTGVCSLSGTTTNVCTNTTSVPAVKPLSFSPQQTKLKQQIVTVNGLQPMTAAFLQKQQPHGAVLQPHQPQQQQRFSQKQQPTVLTKQAFLQAANKQQGLVLTAAGSRTAVSQSSAAAAPTAIFSIPSRLITSASVALSTNAANPIVARKISSAPTLARSVVATLPSILRSSSSASSPLITSQTSAQLNSAKKVSQQQSIIGLQKVDGNKSTVNQQSTNQPSIIGLQKVDGKRIGITAAPTPINANTILVAADSVNLQHLVRQPITIKTSQSAPTIVPQPSTTAPSSGLRVWLSASNNVAGNRLESNGNTVLLPSGFDLSKLCPELSKFGILKATASPTQTTTASKGPPNKVVNGGQLKGTNTLMAYNNIVKAGGKPQLITTNIKMASTSVTASVTASSISFASSTSKPYVVTAASINQNHQPKPSKTFQNHQNLPLTINQNQGSGGKQAILTPIQAVPGLNFVKLSNVANLNAAASQGTGGGVEAKVIYAKGSNLGSVLSGNVIPRSKSISVPHGKVSLGVRRIVSSSSCNNVKVVANASSTSISNLLANASSTSKGDVVLTKLVAPPGAQVVAASSMKDAAELQAQQKQLQLQRQLQQIHGGLSRSGIASRPQGNNVLAVSLPSVVPSTSSPIRQIRLSQQQMATLLSQTSLAGPSLSLVTPVTLVSNNGMQTTLSSQPQQKASTAILSGLSKRKRNASAATPRASKYCKVTTASNVGVVSSSSPPTTVVVSTSTPQIVFNSIKKVINPVVTPPTVISSSGHISRKTSSSSNNDNKSKCDTITTSSFSPITSLSSQPQPHVNNADKKHVGNLKEENFTVPGAQRRIVTDDLSSASVSKSSDKLSSNIRSCFQDKSFDGTKIMNARSKARNKMVAVKVLPQTKSISEPFEEGAIPDAVLKLRTYLQEERKANRDLLPSSLHELCDAEEGLSLSAVSVLAKPSAAGVGPSLLEKPCNLSCLGSSYNPDHWQSPLEWQVGCRVASREDSDLSPGVGKKLLAYTRGRARLAATKLLVQAARESASMTAATLRHFKSIAYTAHCSRKKARWKKAPACNSEDAVRFRKKKHKYYTCLLEARTCVYETDAATCGVAALPGTRHCLRHITYNIDQQLFTRCTARPLGAAMCRAAVFDPSDTPLCRQHKGWQPTNGSPAPAKKPHRKKSKMPVLSRYGKRKRRRSSTPHAAGAAYGKGGKSSGKGGKVVPSTVVRPPMNNGLVLSRAPYGGGAYDVGASLLLPSSPPHTPALTTTSCSECGGGGDCCGGGDLDGSLELPNSVMAAATSLLDPSHLDDLLLDDQHEDVFGAMPEGKCFEGEGGRKAGGEGPPMDPIDSMICSSFNQQQINVINQFLGSLMPSADSPSNSAGKKEKAKEGGKSGGGDNICPQGGGGTNLPPSPSHMPPTPSDDDVSMVDYPVTSFHQGTQLV